VKRHRKFCGSGGHQWHGDPRRGQVDADAASDGTAEIADVGTGEQEHRDDQDDSDVQQLEHRDRALPEAGQPAKPDCLIGIHHQDDHDDGDEDKTRPRRIPGVEPQGLTPPRPHLGGDGQRPERENAGQRGEPGCGTEE
jgi:hypothetical protein